LGDGMIIFLRKNQGDGMISIFKGSKDLQSERKLTKTC